jgi:hypothetical protein
MNFILFAVLVTFAIPAVGADSLPSYLAVIAERLDPCAEDALNHIEGTGRRLLAARAYLTNADTLAVDWSWTQQQIDAYEGSPAQQQLNAEIDRVRREFESRNPGFTLFVNPEVRSLDVQIEHWNTNTSVATAADELVIAAAKFLASDAVPAANTDAGRDSFAQFLLAYEQVSVPRIAAPGLSLHGQMRAVDFQVESGGNTIASPDMSSVQGIWLMGGWRDKLAAAVIASGARFAGPLEQPDEPWHYTYCDTPFSASPRPIPQGCSPYPVPTSRG